MTRTRAAATVTGWAVAAWAAHDSGLARAAYRGVRRHTARLVVWLLEPPADVKLRAEQEAGDGAR